MEQSNVFDFDGFQIERESYLGGDCYGVVTSCKKDGAGIPYHWRWSLIFPRLGLAFPSVTLMRWSLIVWGVYVVCHAYLICKCYLLFLPRHVVLCIQLLLIALCGALM